MAALTLLVVLAFGLAATNAANADAAKRADASWIRVNTTAQGQLLAKLRERLVSDYGQAEGDYDYGVVEKLAVSGTLNAQDYTDLRNAVYAGDDVEKLDLSGVVDPSTQVLSGMTALTDVSLPPVGAYTLANPFQGDVNLRNVVVAAETYTFGSATTFNGATSLQRIVFLHPTKPPTTSLTAATFAGSSNADPTNRTVTAVVPDKTRGDYDSAAFTQYFTNVVETADAGDFAELQNVIDEAAAIDGSSAAADFRWEMLQGAIDDASSVHDDAASTGAEIYGARLVLQTAINRIGVADLGLSLKVTHGADVTLSWKNGTAQHYAEFTPHPVAKVDSLSDDDYDIYVPTVTIPYVSQNIASAVIHGETDKVAKIFTTSAATANAQYTLDLTPLDEREDTALLIPGLGAGDNRGLYTNLDNTGVVNLNVGQHFDLDTFRTQQAQLDQINNLFIEPDYAFDVSGDSVTTQGIGLDGRRQLRIIGEQPGVSVIKVTYGPLHYLAANDNGTPGNTNWSFNGIDPQNTGLVVVNVGGDGNTFDTGIEIRNELDTYYFDKTVGERDFTFTPAAGTTVRVHDPLNVSPWGSGWHSYETAPDGSFTVALKGGRNIIELTNDGKVEYRVVRAKGVDVAVANTTDPGRPFEAGDTARVSITGIEGGIEKLGGIYNPAFVAGTKAKLTYYDGDGALVSNEALQYQTAITAFNVDYTYTGDGDKALNGDMSIGGLGAEWPYHRQIPLEGKPANLAAVAIGPYHFGGMPPIYVHGDEVSTVPGAPGVPTGLQVAYGNGSAEVSWAAPTSTGGLPVSGYRLRYSSDGGDTWETETFGPGTTQTVLTDLDNGTEYEVQVSAFNRSSEGGYTASQTVTPRTAPGVPTGLELAPQHNALDVSWTAPDSGGSAITGYRLRYSSDAGQTWTAQDHGAETQQTLTGLAHGTSYEVQVAAINAEGVGDFTPSATATPVKAGAVLGVPSVEDLATTSAKIVIDVDPGDLDQRITVEHSVNSDHSDSSVSTAESVAAGAGNAAVVVSLTGLAPDETYYYRVLATGSDDDVVSTGWDSFTTRKPDAPTVSLTADAADLRVGDTVKLTWSSGDAETVTASGDWSGPKAASGTQDVALDRAGDFKFTLTATGDGGATTASVDLEVALAPATLTVKAPTGLVHVGRDATVAATGLAAGEAYRITIGGITVGSGVTPDSGSLSRAVTVPAKLRDGAFPVRVDGSLADRAGSTSLRVVAAKKLTVKVAKAKVRRGKRQRVSVSGLAAYEPVRILYRGKKIAVRKASGKGTVTRAFAVGRSIGVKKIKVLGITNDRTGAKAFKVTR
ncbi:MAG: fibronectin type III domain-containing protein [Solirubrobacterales bacterium]|nr:fibronectin type III domain-containing protein [Solirubrobacterales bacterium]